jgi:hypothetical protein
MTRVRIRPLLAATAASAVLSYGLFGHGLPQLSAHDDMAGVAGLCLLLATILGFAATPKPEAQHPAVVEDVAPRYVDRAQHPLLNGRARASPSALQRFRN